VSFSRPGWHQHMETDRYCSPVYSNSDEITNHWIPIADFQRDDADVSAFFLTQNNVEYLLPVYDPWFNASDLDSGGYYYANNYVNAVGCVDQYGICTAVNGTGCTPYSSLTALRAAIEKMPFNLPQLATARRLVNATTFTSTFFSVFGLNQAGMISTSVILSLK
jgi:hypothetical protein